MSILLVCYDLHMDSAYKTFYDTLESYEHCWAMDNHCLIQTDDSTDEVRSRLLPSIGDQDSLMISRFSGEWAGIRDEAETWLKEKQLSKTH